MNGNSEPQEKPNIPPIIRRTHHGTWWILAAIFLVCLLTLELWRPGPKGAPTGPIAAAIEEDTSRIFPPQAYDLLQDDPPPAAVPELGLSKQDVINFREWLAAGAPRYWKGQNMFPSLNDEQWLIYRQRVIANTASLPAQLPKP